MIGKIIDINNMEATISLVDGRTMHVSVSYIPHHSKIGDRLNIEPFQAKLTSKVSANMSIPPMC